ncbi:hypothetical protein N6H14_19800 [Paenibacillus sp. CC-CFT747]|nr:hypothetical protein N6H14_19800 [Paenibacillus sp. CC-CFT747]
MQRLASEWLTEEDYQPVLNVDLQCELDKDPMKWIRQLEKLAPFGMGNPTPKFAFHGLRVLDRKVMGKEQQHIKFQLAHQTEDGCTIDALGFGKSFLSERISPTSRVDVLGELSINEWNGSKKSQLIIQDIRVPDVQVFDWRGIQDLDNRWKAWREQEEAAVSRVLLVFSEGTSASLCGWRIPSVPAFGWRKRTDRSFPWSLAIRLPNRAPSGIWFYTPFPAASGSWKPFWAR